LQPLQRGNDELDCLAHDARNILSGLMLYCELLATPGVFSEQHSHYAQELQEIVLSAAQIIERMAAAQPVASPIPLAAVPVTDLASDLRHLQPLLAAIAGPAIQLSVAAVPCTGRIALAIEDLTRILVNLVRNAADAMTAGGNIRIAAQYGDGFSFLGAESHAFDCGQPRSVVLTVSDDGPGIPESMQNQVFEPGFTTRKSTLHHRGQGLSIVRNLVAAAGGSICLTSAPAKGARFEITLPFTDFVTSGTWGGPPNSAFPTDYATGPA
jgi:signal transduction histidine kinase